MNPKSVSKSKLKEKSVSDKKNKTPVPLNEVQPYYNREVWFVTSKAAKSKIESRIKQLEKISTEILTISDVAHEEKEAHKYLCNILGQVGCTVHHHFIHPTAFKAVYQSANLKATTSAPTVGLICEYDAIKDFGHSSGNNLVTEATIATLIGIREAMKSDTRLVGRLVVFGTPASEESGGKIKMMKEGGFNGVDVVLAVNPSDQNCLLPKFYCSQKVKMTFYGRTRHIDCLNTIKSENPVDAAVISYNNLMTVSNQIQSNSRIHCIIKKGGDVDYLVPKKCELMVCIKAPDFEELDAIQRRVIACGESAANTTRTKVIFDILDDDMYCYLNHNKVLANVFKEEAKALGIDFDEEIPTKPVIYRSTDMGNLSQKVALIYPSFSIASENVPPVHTQEFASTITRADAQTNTIRASIAMTFTIIKYLLNPSLRNEIKQQFDSDVSEVTTKVNKTKIK